jgi:hypothetical protein
MIDVIARKTFMRSLKPLHKRYPNLHKDITALIAILSENPTYGIDLGEGLYKVKMLITDKKTGKNGGARVITYLTQNDVAAETITIELILIYDKSDTADVSKQDLLDLLEYE